jgi:hypothetical protein
MPTTIKIEVRNLSQQSLWSVGVVDGSEEGIRYPHYLPRIALGGRLWLSLLRPKIRWSDLYVWLTSAYWCPAKCSTRPDRTRG